MKRAIGIVRVSEVGGRRDDQFHSPAGQRARIEAECERNGWDLLPFGKPELNVSGGLPLDQRPALGPAVRMVEAGELEIIVFAYRDRADRSIETGSELVRRVEAAGGLIVAGGEVLSHATADKWMQATVGSLFGEYQRRIIKEKAAEGQAEAIAAGKVPWPRVTLGYRRNPDGTWSVDEERAELTAEIFRLRAAGATVETLQDRLAQDGVRMSVHGVTSLLGSRTVLGEVRFAGHENLAAFPPIVDRDVFDAVQARVIPRGRRGKSERLLARLGVLVCAQCGARLVVGTQRQHGRSYSFYRCPDTARSCARPRPSISAVAIEEYAVKRLQELSAHLKGSASPTLDADEKRVAYERAEDELRRAFDLVTATGLDVSDPAVVARLTTLREDRDRKKEIWKVAERREGVRRTVSALDWEDLSWEGKRGLIRAAFLKIEVGSGRGLDRVTPHVR